MSLRETIGMAVDILTRDEGVHRRLVEASVERALCAGLKPFIAASPIHRLYLVLLSRQFRAELDAYERLIRSTKRIMSTEAVYALYERLIATSDTLVNAARSYGIVPLRHSSPLVYGTYLLALFVGREGTLPTD